MQPLEYAERAVDTAVRWVQLGVEVASALMIVVGAFAALVAYARRSSHSISGDYTSVRLLLAHHLVVALELQLAADILATAVAPSWDRIGKLAAIATIRTVLNHFLVREMGQEERRPRADDDPASRSHGRSAPPPRDDPPR